MKRISIKNGFGVGASLVALLLILLSPSSIRAQEPPSAVSGAPGEIQTPASESGEQPPAVAQGISRGVYWWSDLNMASLASLGEFGVNTVAFRLGTIGLAAPEQGNESTGPRVTLVGGPSPESFQGAPVELRFRPVIEVGPEFWRGGPPADLVNFLARTTGQLSTDGMVVDSIELKVTGLDGQVAEALSAFLKDPSLAGLPSPVVIGLDANETRALLLGDFDLSPFTNHGLVLYFTDYDYTGASPRITDRAWIDATCSAVDRLGIPFTAVLPIYNRAIVYSGTGSGRMVPALDLQKVTGISDVRPMGAAGTEYVLNAALEGSSPLAAGDRILVVESIKQLSISDVTAELPTMAPKCREIDLFRFPLVPGFDPSPDEVFLSAGWSQQAPAQAAQPDLGEKAALDNKYNKGQQFIMITTFVLMGILLMRMMSKGKEPAQGSGTGPAGTGKK